MELLSPSGDFESLKAAVNNGANAVYLGMQLFNARKKAENFDEENIFEAVKYAHLRGVKVYLTVNILIYNNEFENLINLVKKAIEANVDAFIVQDLGVAKVLKECFKGIELHASTQMGVHNLAGAKILENFGFKRVVLSRETKLNDIKEIKQHTNLEIEFFVQGALCSSFSGNCLISSFACGESGNRGRCTQLCRLKYKTQSGIEGFLMSTKDLCLIDNLKTLIDAGVTSFKIEGRLRRAGYVAVVTECYRKALDNLNLKTEKAKIEKVFSRGKFNNSAYLFDNDNKLNIFVNNHQGIKIGKVVKVSKFKDLFKVEMLLNKELNNGDGLKFYDGYKEVQSLGVGNVEKQGDRQIIFTKKFVNPDLNVYLTLDNQMEQLALSKVKKIAIKMSVEALCQKPIKLNLTCGNISIEYVGDIMQKAIKQPLSIDAIVQCLSKGGGDYDIEVLSVNTDGVFVAKSVLNGYRREALAVLEKEILNSYSKKIVPNGLMPFSISEKKQKKPIVVINDSMQQEAFAFCDSLFAYAFDTKNLEECLNKKVGLCLPIIATGEEISEIDNLIDKVSFVVTNNLWGLKYIGKTDVYVGVGLNVFNNYAKNAYEEMGVKGVILSVEQNLKDYKLTDEYYFKLGYPSLMNFAYCPYKEIFGKCNSCKNELILSDNFRTYNLRRIKLRNCYFELYGTFINCLEAYGNSYLDLRGLSFDDIKKIDLSGGEVLIGESKGKAYYKIK